MPVAPERDSALFGARVGSGLGRREAAALLLVVEGLEYDRLGVLGGIELLQGDLNRFFPALRLDSVSARARHESEIGRHHHLEEATLMPRISAQKASHSGRARAPYCLTSRQ